MAALQKQALDVKLLGLDEKANPREAVPGTLTSLENCVIYKDGRIQKRPGIAALPMADYYGPTITNARELASHKGELILNDGNRWYQRHPVTGAWLRRGFSAYERLDIAPLCATTAQCNGTDSRLEVDTAAIGRYGLVVTCGESLDQAGWRVLDRDTGAILINQQSLTAQDICACSDGAAEESFVIFGGPQGSMTTTCAISAYVLTAADGFRSISASGPVVTDAYWSLDENVYFGGESGRGCVSYDVVRVAANTWLLAYHQYQTGAGDHSRIAIRKIVRTSGATFTVSDAVEVEVSATQTACAFSWAYQSGEYAHLAWESNGQIRSVRVTIADFAVSFPPLAFGFNGWTMCRGIAGYIVGAQPYFVLDLASIVEGKISRFMYLWQVGAGQSMLLRDAGLLTKAFAVENQLSNEFGVGVFVPSTWQSSAFLLRVRVDGHDALGTTVGGHMAAGNFAGKATVLRLASGNGGAFFPVSFQANTDRLGGIGTVNVGVASIRNPLAVSSAPTPSAYATQGQPVEVGGVSILPGAALKQYDGETVCEAAFYVAPDWVRPTESDVASNIENGTRQYTAVARWTDAQGRMHRSAPCPPASVTVIGQHDINVLHPFLHLTERCGPGLSQFNYNPQTPDAVIEIYRTTASGSTFYLVGTVKNTVNAEARTFADSSPDTAILGNEQLYTTGGAVQNWPVTGCNVVAVHQGRVFTLASDGAVKFTGYMQDGEALFFAEEYALDTQHVPGAITALLSMDDKLVICTDATCASLTGLGPESTGTPSYDAPMVVASTLGPLGPRACVRVPDGVVMPTRHGIFMLDRGLGFQYIGPSVETSGAFLVPGYAGACHPARNQVRLFGSGSSRAALVYDWTLQGPPNRPGQWMKWPYAVDVVATATCAGSLYYLGHNGVVYLADSGTSDAGTAYQQSLQFSVLSPTGVGGWSRIYKMRLAVDLAASCSLNACLNPEEGSLTAETYTLAAGPSGKRHVDLKPRRGKLSSVTCWLGEATASQTAGFTLDSVALLVGNKGGLGRLSTTSRMTRSTP